MAKTKNVNMLAALLPVMAMSALSFEGGSKRIHNSPKHETHSWDKIDIPKKQRKGKTYEELQEMRKNIWLDMQR